MTLAFSTVHSSTSTPSSRPRLERPKAVNWAGEEAVGSRRWLYEPISFPGSVEPTRAARRTLRRRKRRHRQRQEGQLHLTVLSHGPRPPWLASTRSRGCWPNLLRSVPRIECQSAL
eukprot:scaffold11090_cov40-Phaeocystis_antarctica.AAC.1